MTRMERSHLHMGNDYSFLQEKIKDEAGSPKTMKKKVVRMMILGFVFGVVACFTFIVIKPVMSNLLGQDKEEVTIPKDEEIVDNEEIIDEDTQKEEAKQEEQLQVKVLKDLQRNAKAVSPAMVYISGQRKIEKDTEIKKTAGIILADNGSEILVLSQTLSSKELKNIRITFADGREYAASVKMKDNNIGIVICAVEKEDMKSETLEQMKIVKLGNSRLIRTGDTGFMLGKKEKDSMSVSYGFIIAGNEKMEMADGGVGIFRVDVAGASFENGMLFNQNGEMIGLVNSKINENQALVTVLSISDIKNELERMSNGKTVPYIGIRGELLPEELNEEGTIEGIYVEEIETDSPAMEAGVQPGDIITQISESKITDMDEYRSALLKSSVKDVIIISGLRKGVDDSFVEMEFEVVVGRK